MSMSVICERSWMTPASVSSSIPCEAWAMFLKNDPDCGPAKLSSKSPKPWSLATRLTAWYAGSAFALVLITAAFLYWTSIRNLDREDDRLLGDRARVLVGVLQNRPGDVEAVRREVFEEWDAHQR